jgi:hemerythrin-like domain-containing protein
MATRNAIDLLKADHANVKNLFEQWENAETDQRARVAETVFAELEVHADLEEHLFYPAFRQRADKEEIDLLDEALKEHKEAKQTIAKLKALGADEDEKFETLFDDLVDAVSHHVEEEETEMLPRAERKLGDQLERLAIEMQQRKEHVAVKK